MRCLLVTIAAILPMLLPLSSHAGGSVTIIDDGAGILGPQATAIAGDGSRVAGSDLFLSGWQYTTATGLVPLPGLPSDGRLVVDDISTDGTTIVGQARKTGGWEAFRYTAASGTQPLGTLAPDMDSVAHAVSGDGSFVVGRSNGVAFGWTQAGGMAPLSGAIGIGSFAYGVSADGTVVAGFAFGVSVSAFRWTAGSGMVDLGTLPGDESSSAGPVSADGTTIGGESYDQDTDTSNAFRWTQSARMVSLGRCPGSFSASATDISGDGSVIIGDCWSEDSGGAQVRTGFVWTRSAGLQTFHDYLSAQGVDGSAIIHPVLEGVSDDGRVFTGYDDDPNDINAFIVRIGAPVPALPTAGVWLLALGLLAAARSLRREMCSDR
jgi:probable HAF family extracellular repeat protein